ncbi:MAG: hypothetical protein ACI8UO_005279 [Verrucomicrobiales bacterium]|jgi:hypothetical protein
MIQSARFLLQLLALSALAAGVSSYADDTPVATSAEQLGEPVEPSETLTLNHVKVGEECRDHLEVGEVALSRPNGKLTVRVRIQNVCDRSIDFEIRSAFFRSDGSIVPTPYPHTPDPIEGMARGFVGLISLGASEVTIELETSEPTIETRHSLEPGKALIVEHQLPYVDENVVGARAFLVAGSNLDLEHESEVKRTLEEQYWKARDNYFAQRKAENLRWDRQRKKLEANREDLPAVSSEYKQVMNRYWDEHRDHLARIQKIEAGFDRFREDQKRLMTDELKPVEP